MSMQLAEKTHRGEILAVDDTAASLAYLSELLTREGYTVRVAPSGELALWTVSGRPPDLVLLDVRMPGMDGYEVCRHLKSNPLTAAVPVIFLSAQTDVVDKVRGFQAGGVDYIAKPFSTEDILQRVATHLKIAQLTKALEVEKDLLEQRVRQRTAALELSTQALRDEVAAKNAAEVRQRLAAGAFEASLSGGFITDQLGRIVTINPAFTEITGYLAEECLGKTTHLLDSGRHGPDFFAAIAAVLELEGKWSGEIWFRRKDGNAFPCLHTLTALSDDGGGALNFVGTLLDLSESKDAQTLIEFLTRHDPLTGLPNRVLVRDRFAQLLEGQDGHGEKLAVFCINLDRFRYINEFHGHAVGDQILQWVSTQITECLPGKDTLYREGGDEFFLVHRDSSSLLETQQLIESILACLNNEFPVSGSTIVVSASIGVAIYPDDGTTLDELSANAAVAMARAKANGGEAYAYFTGKTDLSVRNDFDLAQRLRYALERGELEVYYQPQNDAVSGNIVSAEALLRWKTADLGFISPARFIPLAEETGRIVDIGTWVMRSVCQQIARWHGQRHGWLKVAVNLSARQLIREDLPQTVKAILDDSSVPPACLELEITEGSVIEDAARCIATLLALKAIGVTVSLDDFGTGYSSLSYLRRFPIDCLKIDQSFVRELQTAAEGESEPLSDANAIVLSIIGLAHNLRLKVVAEGVETAAQRDFLAARGCDVLQGYLFSRPVPAEDFLALLLDWRRQRTSDIGDEPMMERCIAHV